MMKEETDGTKNLGSGGKEVQVRGSEGGNRLRARVPFHWRV
jgi:hypothetical protein